MKLRPKNRRRREVRRWRLPALEWRRVGLTIAGVVAIALIAGAIAWTLDQPIDRVTVAGRFQRVAPPDVEQIVRLRIGTAGLASVDLEAVRRAIDRLPWVDRASVQREWPRSLRVTVVEQVAAARWGGNGLLNVRGELFLSEARHIPPELPKLSGPHGSEPLVARRYLAMQGRLVEAGMRLAALRLDARGAWELDLDNGVTVRLGSRDFDARFARLHTTALRLVAERATDMSYVDMRYTNGFAIGWRRADTRLALRSAEDAAEDGA